MARLIDDLIPLILDSHDHWWNRDLVRFALISPAWLYHVRRRLYASPCLYSFPACVALVRTLEDNSYLAALVKHMKLRPMRDYSFIPSSRNAHLSIRSLLALEHLQTLELGGELAIQSERFLGFVSSAETIAEIHIDGTLLRNSLTSRPSLEWSEDLPYRFPCLKKLRLSNLELDLSPAVFPKPLELEELILEDVHFMSGFLSYLMPDGSEIKELSIKCSWSCDWNTHIRSVLFSSDVRVHAMKYEVEISCPSDSSFLEQEGLPEPTSAHLRRLELHGLHINGGTLTSVTRSCPLLRELVISGRSVHITPDDWKTYHQVGTGGLSSLERLVWL